VLEYLEKNSDCCRLVLICSHKFDVLYSIGSHTSTSIKKQFDEMTEKFNITDKLFKIVADQAANVKCAFKNTTSAQPESDAVVQVETDPLAFVSKLTFTMLFQQRKAELIAQKESILTQQMLKVILIFIIIFSRSFLLIY
jgi:hypothetical protein